MRPDVDRLYDTRHGTPHDQLLHAAAQAELTFERYRHLRRWFVLGAAVAAALSWAHLTAGLVLYGVIAPLALATALCEHLARRTHRAQIDRLASHSAASLRSLVVILPLPPLAVELACLTDLDRVRRHLTAVAHGFVAASALTGLFPLVHALSPRLVPTALLHLTWVFWATPSCVLICIALEIWMLEADRRGIARRLERDVGFPLDLDARGSTK
jgi:hypothetical protein